MLTPFRKVFDFFLFSSLFISICAVLMAWQTGRLLHFHHSDHFLWFIFFATICSYNFHWYLTPESPVSKGRLGWSRQYKVAHLLFYLVGFFGSLVFFILLHAHWGALLMAVFITFLYSAPKVPLPYFRYLKRIAYGKTIFLAFVWTYVTTILPLIISGDAFSLAAFLLTGSRFFLVYSICILFDYRDKEEDSKDGIKSMIVYFNETHIDLLFSGSIIIFAIFTASLLYAHFSILSVVTLLIPGIITAGLYALAKRNFSDYLYYFVLDGLMAFSALLMLILPI